MQRLFGKRGYLDTNVLIAILENAAPALEPLLLLQQAGSLSLATSDLAYAELLVKPLEAGNGQAVAAYENLFSSGALDTVPLTRPVLRRAAEIRAATRLKLPDAIHLASAEVAGCGFFLSDDRRLRGKTALTVLATTELKPIPTNP